MMPTDVIVAACQLPDLRDDIEQALSFIEIYASKAEAQGASLVCFPECYLQGYVIDAERTPRLALDLSSSAFQRILTRLAHLRPALTIGLIESEAENLYNTAVVVRRGALLGSYRKTFLLPGESLFKAGDSYPVFEVAGLSFGINICNDTNFSASAEAVAGQNADLIVCPANNMMRRDVAEIWKHEHNEVRAERARETGLWLVSSDVTGERDGRISYGPTAVIDPGGSVVAQVPLLEVGMVMQAITVR